MGAEAELEREGTVYDSEGEGEAASGVRLVRLHGSGNIELEGEVTLGRGKHGCDNARLSETHCRIAAAPDGGVVLEDLSKNGTFVNGVNLDGGQRGLKHGDTISMLRPQKWKGSENIEFVFTEAASASGQKRKREGSDEKGEQHLEADLQAKRVKKGNEDLQESLTCGICTEVFYKPVSCIPCLHNFCAPCFSEHLKMSESTKICPLCRQPVSEIRRNHSLQGACEALLLARPDLQRSAEQIKALDAKNTITSESLRIKGKKQASDGGDSDDSDFLDGSDDVDYDEENIANAALGVVQALLRPASHMLCRECTEPGPDGFRCDATRVNHLHCTTCGVLFANRGTGLPKSRQQRCSCCMRPYCNLYYGACSGAAEGPLMAIKAHSFPDIPSHTFASNAFEQQVLRTWAASQNLTSDDLWARCLEKFGSQTWAPQGLLSCTPTSSLSPDSVACRKCCEHVYSGLLYHLRRNIPPSELSPAVAHRDDCWYGLRCRTQHTKPTHAANLNHVCLPIKH